MKTYLLLSASLPFLLLACGGSGGSSSNSNRKVPAPELPKTTTPKTPEPVPDPIPEPKYKMTTGFVKGEPVKYEKTYFSVVEYDHEDGKFIAYSNNADKLTSKGHVREAKLAINGGAEVIAPTADQPEPTVTVTGEVIKTVEGVYVGYSDLFSFGFAGQDSAGNSFASATHMDVVDPTTYQQASPTANMTFSSTNYGYVYVNSDTGDTTRKFGDDGQMTLNNGVLTGNFNNGELTLSGNMNGYNLDNGQTILTIDGKKYQGSTDGKIRILNESGVYTSDGAFVSSDASDEILYAGGWAGFGDVK